VSLLPRQGEGRDQKGAHGGKSTPGTRKRAFKAGEEDHTTASLSGEGTHLELLASEKFKYIIESAFKIDEEPQRTVIIQVQKNYKGPVKGLAAATGKKIRTRIAQQYLVCICNGSKNLKRTGRIKRGVPFCNPKTRLEKIEGQAAQKI